MFRADGPYLQHGVCDIIRPMTEPAESTAEPARSTEQALYRNDLAGLGRLGQALVVVGIVAGVVFITAVIFFAGFFVAGDRSGYGGPDGWPYSVRTGGRPGICPMMGGGGMMGPNLPPTPTPSP